MKLGTDGRFQATRIADWGEEQTHPLLHGVLGGLVAVNNSRHGLLDDEVGAVVVRLRVRGNP